MSLAGAAGVIAGEREGLAAEDAPGDVEAPRHAAQELDEPHGTGFIGGELVALEREEA